MNADSAQVVIVPDEQEAIDAYHRVITLKDGRILDDQDKIARKAS